MAESLCTWPDAVAKLRNVRLGRTTENLPLEQAIGHHLAAPVAAESDYPRFRSSAMDGWALHPDDLKDANQNLRVAGEILAGQNPLPLKRGECLRVMTGAPLPEEAGGVVPVEYAHIAEDKLVWDTDAPTRNIRERAEDIRHGERLMEKDQCLTPTRAMLLASAGVQTCAVYAKPTVALLKSGDEIQAQPGPYGIFDSTTACLQSLVTANGGHLHAPQSLPDDLSHTIAALSQQVEDGVSLILTTGGVSKGVADFIPQAVEHLGGTIHLHRLAIKPAKPLLLATFPNGTVLVGLPGNPLSQLVAYALAVVPLLVGRAPLDITTHQARLGSEVLLKGNLLTFLRSEFLLENGRLVAHVLPSQESHRVSNLTQANGWILAHGTLAAGETVQILPFPHVKVPF